MSSSDRVLWPRFTFWAVVFFLGFGLASGVLVLGWWVVTGDPPRDTEIFGPPVCAVVGAFVLVAARRTLRAARGDDGATSE